MRIKIKKKIAFILIPLILFSTISGCFRAPASNGFKISEIALYRTAVIDAPKDVKITHLWSKPDGEDKIIITFNKDVDPSQKTPISHSAQTVSPIQFFQKKIKMKRKTLVQPFTTFIVLMRIRLPLEEIQNTRLQVCLLIKMHLLFLLNLLQKMEVHFKKMHSFI